MNLTDDLRWRYATKNMTGESISADQLEFILSAANLSATSYGLQPFTIVAVSNKEVKMKLQAAAYGQAQVGSSSHVLVFAVPTKITPEDIQAYINNIGVTRNIPAEALEGLKNMMTGTIGNLPAEQQQIWAAKQAYISLGTALAAAANQRIDACPMEGFDATQFDEILGLTEQGLRSVVIMPIGFRSPDDASANYIKVRKPESEIFKYVV